jgi:hypothetical protein
MAMRKNRLHIEVLPSPAEIRRGPVDRAELDRLVQEKVAEILTARDEFVFEPFFRSRQIAYELKRLQTVPEQRKWTVRYERLGCMICNTKERIHGGNGMCSKCYTRESNVLKQIIAEGIKGEPAHAARGAKWEQRLLPENALGDGVHHTYYDPTNAEDKASYQRVATKLGVSYSHVRAVARGKQQSESVLAALKEEQRRTR